MSVSCCVQDVTQLGEIMMLSHVRIQTENGDRRERLLLLFPGTLMLLSVTARVSGYVYEVNVITNLWYCRATVSDIMSVDT